MASELGRLAVWEFGGAGEVPQGGSQEDEDRTGESSAPRGSGPSPHGMWLGRTPGIYACSVWLEEKEACLHELLAHLDAASFLPQPGEGCGSGLR